MIASRSTVMKTNACPAAQRASRPSCRAVVVNAKKQSSEPSRGSAFRATMVAGFAAAALMMSSQPAQALQGLSGRQPAQEVGNSILDKDLGTIDNSNSQQPNDAIKQGVDEVKDVLIQQAQEATSNASANGKDDRQRSEGLQSGLAQIKSILGFP